RQRCGALVVLSSPMVLGSIGAIATAALKHRLPAICLFVPAFTDAGGLIAYGPEFIDLFRRGGNYLGRILKGAKPGDLPIQRPAKFALAVNLKTARMLGISLPQALVLRADHVIR